MDFNPFNAQPWKKKRMGGILGKFGEGGTGFYGLWEGGGGCRVLWCIYKRNYNCLFVNISIYNRTDVNIHYTYTQYNIVCTKNRFNSNTQNPQTFQFKNLPILQLNSNIV